MADRFFFRSAKETSKVIPDVRGIGKVVPMKKREIRNICSGCLTRYFQKSEEKIFRKKGVDFWTMISEKSCHWKTP